MRSLGWKQHLLKVKMMQLWQMAVFGALLFNAPVFSNNSDLNLSGGYRNDTYKSVNNTKDSGQTTQSDTIRVENVNIWHVGVNGRIALPNFTDYCLENFSLSGFAYWGIGAPSGRLHEHVVSYIGAGELHGKAKLKRARTYDFQLGANYLFDWNEWSFGLSAGYAYDEQKIATKSGKISFPEGAPYVDSPLYGSGYQTKTKWRGPFVGTGIEYDWCLWHFGAWYELHFANYSANHVIPNNFLARLQGVDSQTHSSRAYGNIAALSADYRFCSGWQVGAIFTYQHWQANKGHLKSYAFELDGVPATTKVVTTSEWIAYGIILNVGYTF